VPSLTSRLPSIYHRILPEFLERSYPDERFATCDSCLNCQSPNSPYVSTKCCTYYPSLPNYLVGGILSDQDARSQSGRDRTLALIASAIGVTPYGVVRPAQKAARLRELTPPGRVPNSAEAESLLCAFYEQGQCTVWNYREHLCSTYFCYSVGGATGKGFWKILNDYLKLVERELCLHALLTMGWPIDELKLGNPLSDWEPSERPSVNRRRRGAWREFAGREAELYIECHRIIAATDRATVATLLGWKGQRLEERLAVTLSQFTQAVTPERLRRADTIQIVDAEDNDVRVSVDGLPGVRVPRIVASFITQFDGNRPTSQVVRLAASVDIDVARHIAALRAAGALTEL